MGDGRSHRPSPFEKSGEGNREVKVKPERGATALL